MIKLQKGLKGKLVKPLRIFEGLKVSQMSLDSYITGSEVSHLQKRRHGKGEKSSATLICHARGVERRTGVSALRLRHS